MLRIAPALAALLLLSMARAQEDAPAPAAPTSADVIKALETAVTGESAHFEGNVSRKSSGPGALGGAVMIMGPGGPLGGGKPGAFESGFAAMRSGKDLVIRSAERLPGFEAFVRKGRRVVRTTTDGKPLDAMVALGDLTDLMDGKRLLRAAKNAEWKIESTATGSAEAIAKLGATLIRPPVSDEEEGEFDEAGPAMSMPFGQPKSVEYVQASVRLDENGKVARMRFAVVRFDPQKAMMRRLMARAMEGETELEFNPAEFEVTDKKPSDMDEDVNVLEPAKPQAALAKLREELSALLK